MSKTKTASISEATVEVSLQCPSCRKLWKLKLTEDQHKQLHIKANRLCEPYDVHCAECEAKR